MKRLVVLILALTLIGCAGMTREEQGAATGAVLGIALGALVGDQLLDCQGCAAIGGAVGGLALGSIGASWGAELDRLDRQNIKHALEHQRSGQPSAWINPDSGVRHEVVAKPATQERGTYCREFQDNVTIAGKTQPIYGKACRKPDGNWELVQ